MKPQLWFVLILVVAVLTGVGVIFLTDADLFNFKSQLKRSRWKRSKPIKYLSTKDSDHRHQEAQDQHRSVATEKSEEVRGMPAGAKARSLQVSIGRTIASNGTVFTYFWFKIFPILNNRNNIICCAVAISTNSNNGTILDNHQQFWVPSDGDIAQLIARPTPFPPDHFSKFYFFKKYVHIWAS